MRPRVDKSGLTEELEVLAGLRRGAQERAAVRFEHLGELMALNQTLQSAPAAGSTPTTTEFDKLVEDVHEIHRRLSGLIDQLSEAQRR